MTTAAWIAVVLATGFLAFIVGVIVGTAEAFRVIKKSQRRTLIDDEHLRKWPMP